MQRPISGVGRLGAARAAAGVMPSPSYTSARSSSRRRRACPPRRLRPRSRLPRLGQVVPDVLGVEAAGDVDAPRAEEVGPGRGDAGDVPAAPVVADEVDGLAASPRARRPATPRSRRGGAEAVGHGRAEARRRQGDHVVAAQLGDQGVPDGGRLGVAVDEDDGHDTSSSSRARSGPGITGRRAEAGGRLEEVLEHALAGEHLLGQGQAVLDLEEPAEHVAVVARGRSPSASPMAACRVVGSTARSPRSAACISSSRRGRGRGWRRATVAARSSGHGVPAERHLGRSAEVLAQGRGGGRRRASARSRCPGRATGSCTPRRPRRGAGRSPPARRRRRSGGPGRPRRSSTPCR